MNIWHDISPDRIMKDDFYAVIEISKGSKIKYELDKETGVLKLDRILYTSTHYPANYGFVPRSFAEDGDPLDVLVLCSEIIAPMSLVRCYPIGVICMLDNGDPDYKVIAIPFEDPTYNSYKDIRHSKEKKLLSTKFSEEKRLFLSLTTQSTDISENSVVQEDNLSEGVLFVALPLNFFDFFEIRY